MENPIIIDDHLDENGTRLSSKAQSMLKLAGIWGIGLVILFTIFSISTLFGGIGIIMASYTFPTANSTDEATNMMLGMGFVLLVFGVAFFIPLFFMARFCIQAVTTKEHMGTETLEKTLRFLYLTIMATVILLILFGISYIGWAVYIGTMASRM